VAEVLLEGIDDYVRWSIEKGVMDVRVYSRLSEIAAKAGLASLSSRRAAELADVKA